MVAVVQLLSHIRLFPLQASLSFTISWSLIKFMPMEFMMLSNHLILSLPLLLLPSIFPCIRVFSSELSLCIRWPKHWSFSFSISPFNEYSGLISFRIDWFDLLAMHGTLKSLLQHHNLKASILRCSKYWSFSFSIGPSNEYSGLISLRIDWFDLLAVQGTLKSLLQYHSSKNSLALSFFYGPTLTSVHDYWKNDSFD